MVDSVAFAIRVSGDGTNEKVIEAAVRALVSALVAADCSGIVAEVGFPAPADVLRWTQIY